MVAGSLRNPWADPNGRLEFGEDYWCPRPGEESWVEQEFSCEGNSGIHERFAGKERAVQDPEDAGEYLFIEEIPASTPRRPMHRMWRDQGKGGPVTCPKRKGSKTPTKGKKTGGENTSGSPSNPQETPAASTPGGSAGGASGSGAGGSPGGSGGGGGKKTPPSSSPGKSPAKKRKRGRKGTAAEDKEDEGGSQTAEDAAQEAGSNPSISQGATVATLTRVTADKSALKRATEDKTGESAPGPSSSAPASEPILPPPPTEREMTEQKGFKKYYCGTECRCNSMTKEELRKAISESSPGDHQYECLHFIRWCETKKELQLLRSELKDNNDKAAAQHKLLEEIAKNAKEAAIIQRSHNQYITDKSALGIPWSDMDYACHVLETVEKQQSLDRVLRRVVYGKDCHYCTEAMLDLFRPEVARRIYPLEPPGSHGHVDRVFFYGREYHMMPRALLHAISRTMADVLPSCKGSAGKAQENLKKNLNETRKAAKAEDHKKFRGRLNIPFYLLLWRDTHSGVFAIQEEAPYHGTQQEQTDYVNRWQSIVDDAIADKHRQGYTHPPA